MPHQTGRVLNWGAYVELAQQVKQLLGLTRKREPTGRRTSLSSVAQRGRR
jgi:hypothetical protein